MEMTLPPNLMIPVSSSDLSQTGHARRQAQALGRSMGLSELRQGQLGIIVTEAASNIAAHAGRGEIVVCPWRFKGEFGLDVLALDNGKGITDLGRSFEDGFSTAGTPGQGLGAMSRLSGLMQIHSAQGQGTALFARVTQEGSSAEMVSGDYVQGAVSLPVMGETACGDAWSAVYTSGRSIYIVADGLGHGPLAAEAAREAVRIFHEDASLSPARILADVHAALTKTRGAAVSIAEILHTQETLNFAGVGNVAGAVFHDGRTRSMVSMNGTLGHTIGKIQQFSYPWEKNSTLIMHSDGLGTRWSVDQYPGLAGRHPSLLAGVLYRDFCRKRDDVTILVTRI
jgi:anti-sigma regulatory factor (Ser/Thr protein kinase)